MKTICGRSLSIVRQGTWNHDQGPDFQNARIEIDGQLWVGNIELHVRSSDWFRHGHSKDENYKNVILHVVWEHDETEMLPFPTLELNTRVSNLMLDRYTGLMSSSEILPCQPVLKMPDPMILMSWKERLVAERLESRSMKILEILKVTGNHWEEVFWRQIARSFGNGINGDAFEQIASCIPLRVLAKHRNSIIQVEALLLGQAGILDREFRDKYPVMLRKEYLFLRKKYSLEKHHFPLNYLRMRPANFPAVRLAQLAALICKSNSLFSVIRETTELKIIKDLFTVEANDYWSYHYRPDHTSNFQIKHTGDQLLNNIITNTVSVMLHAYGKVHGDHNMTMKAIEWLSRIPAERNKVTNIFRQTDLVNRNAFDSQALIQLKQSYCDKKRCLECAIGNSLLRNYQL